MRSNNRLTGRFLFARILSALLIVSIALPPSSVYALRPLAGRESGMEENLTNKLRPVTGQEERIVVRINPVTEAPEWRLETEFRVSPESQSIRDLLSQPNPSSADWYRHDPKEKLDRLAELFQAGFDYYARWIPLSGGALVYYDASPLLAYLKQEFQWAASTETTQLNRMQYTHLVNTIVTQLFHPNRRSLLSFPDANDHSRVIEKDLTEDWRAIPYLDGRIPVWEAASKPGERNPGFFTVEGWHQGPFAVHGSHSDPYWMQVPLEEYPKRLVQPIAALFTRLRNSPADFRRYFGTLTTQLEERAHAEDEVWAYRFHGSVFPSTQYTDHLIADAILRPNSRADRLWTSQKQAHLRNGEFFDSAGNFIEFSGQLKRLIRVIEAVYAEKPEPEADPWALALFLEYAIDQYENGVKAAKGTWTPYPREISQWFISLLVEQGLPREVLGTGRKFQDGLWNELNTHQSGEAAISGRKALAWAKNMQRSFYITEEERIDLLNQGPPVAAGQEEKPEEFPTEHDSKFFEKLGEPQWGFEPKEWAGLWYLLDGKVPQSLDGTLDELNHGIRLHADSKNFWGSKDAEFAQKLIHKLYDRIRNQYGLEWNDWRLFFDLTNGNILADSQRLSVVLDVMISRKTRFVSETPLTPIELTMVHSLRDRLQQSEPLPIDPRMRDFPAVSTEKQVAMGNFANFIIAVTLLGAGWFYARQAQNGGGVVQPDNAPAPAVIKPRQRQSVPAEYFRFKWEGEGPIAEVDGERVDFNDWDKLGEALSQEQVDLFLREQEGAESWLVPVDAALPINRAIHVFDQVGIPSQQLPQNLNYFNLSQDAAAEVTPDLLAQGIKDGDVVILRADQVTPEGAKNLIPEGIKARVVLLTPLMLKQLSARQLLFVATQLDPGETLYIQHLSSVTLESQRYLLIAA